jgi:hypothetical protein
MNVPDQLEPREINYQKPEQYQTSRSIAIAFIVSCAIITLACIAALTIVITAFFLHPPW